MSMPPSDLDSAQQFKEHYAITAQRHVQLGLWFSMGVTFLLIFGPGPIAELRSAMLGDDQMLTFNVLRFGIMLPTAIAIIAVAYSRFYKLYFPVAAQIVILIHVVCLTCVEVMVHRQDYSIAVWMALAIAGVFQAYALHQRQAFRTASVATLIYIAGGYFSHIADRQWALNVCLLLFVLLSGGAAHGILMAALRTQYATSVALGESAQRDALTKLKNRRAFDEHIDLLWHQAARTRTTIALLLVDIDHFKNYNDAAGHLAGDVCLKQVADVIATTARRPMDMVARFGGEEFAVILYDVEQTTVDDIAQALRNNLANAALAHPNSPSGKFVTVSIGGAHVLPTATRTYRGLIQLADEALYAAKTQGRDRAVTLSKEHESLITGRFQAIRTTNVEAA
jgi:diguanylate cyclase (GGDEF)-like protein